MKNALSPIVLLLFLCISVFFIHCKTDNPSETDTTISSIDFKHKNDIAYCRLRAEPDGLNPLLTLNAYGREAYTNIFPYMMNFHPQSLEFAPILVKSAPEVNEIIENGETVGLSYTFELLDEAVWDNGQPLTAYDYEFTLKALFNPKLPTQRLRGFYEFITKLEIDADNPKKFTIHTNKKYILAEEALGSMVILPEYHFDPKGLLKDFALSDLLDSKKAAQLADQDKRLQEFSDEYLLPKYARESDGIVGCGAYKLKEWVTGQHIILEQKENWWGKQLGDKIPALAAYPKEIHFKIMRDQTTALASLKSQDLDAMGQIQPKDFLDLEEDAGFKRYFNLYNPVNPAFYFVAMNMKNPKLSDKKVRWAMSHLMDGAEVIKTTLHGFGQLTIGPVHPNADYYHKGLENIKYDLEKAKQLLAEAGWEDSNDDGVLDKVIEGEKVDMELDYLVSASSSNEKNTALLFQENAKKAGVKVNVIAQEFTVKTKNMTQYKFDLAAGGWLASPSLFDPKQIWHTDSYRPGGSNYVGFGNQESDALIEEIRTTLDEEKRNELYKKLQEIIYEEQPYIFLFFNRNLIAISKRFKAEASGVRPGYFPNTFALNQ